MTVKTLKMGNTDGLCRLQIKLLHFLAAAPQSIKRIRQHLAITEELARELIQPLIADQFITKQGNGQYRNYIKTADIPPLPVVKADTYLLKHGERVFKEYVSDEGEASSLLINRATTAVVALESSVCDAANTLALNDFSGNEILHMYPGDKWELRPIVKSEGRVNLAGTLSFSEFQSLVLQDFAKDLQLTYPQFCEKMSLTEKPAPTPASRQADFNYLARIYSDEWFKQADLVGLHAGEVVKEMASVWPDHKYFGVTPLFTQEELLACRQLRCFKAPISFRRISADLDFLANQYTESWFEEKDLVGVLSLRVVHALSSDFPTREYYGHAPLFDENDILARRIQLGLQQVPCTSCEKTMTPEEVRYSGHICSRCESLNLVKPHASSEPNHELAAALAELGLLKTKLARCHELGQLVASADAKLQYLTGLRLFVKYAAPKGEQYLDEIMADYQQLQSHTDLFAGYGGDK
jgi:hypothetical protein